MTVLKKIVFVLVIILIVGSAAVLVFIASQGRSLVTAELEHLTGRKVSLDTIRPIFPGSIQLEGVKVEGLAVVPKAVIAADMGELLHRRLKIRSIELEAPQINIDLVSFAALEKQGVSANGSTDKVGKVVMPARKHVAYIDRVKVRGGTVVVQAASTGKTWILDNVGADLKDFPMYGVSGRFDFNVTASLAKMNVPFLGHAVKAVGWTNWAARDMDAALEAVDVNGRVGLSAVLKSRANDCEVKGRAHLSGDQSAQASGKSSKMVESTMLNLLSSLKTDIEADFSFRTLLDRFDIGKVSLSGNITTGLQSDELSGNIVGSLKAAGANMLNKTVEPPVKPYKE